MQTPLAVLDHAETAAAVLAAAGLVAQRLGAPAIEALHVRRAEDPSFLPTEEVMTPDRRARFAAGEAARSDAIRTVFDAYRRSAGLPEARWREEQGDPAAIVPQAAGRADLLVIARSAGREVVEACLLPTGAAVLLVAATVPAALGSHVAVAWKPGEPAERAIVAATPLLRAAGRVTVLVGKEAGSAATLPELLVQALAGTAVSPALHPFQPAGAIGPALLHQAHEVGADLLLMGAFAHWRAVEMLFGGATREILGGADLPVLLHH